VTGPAEFDGDASFDVAIFAAQSRLYRGGIESASDLVGVNLLGLTRFLELARRARAKRFVHFSSGSVYSPSFEPLGEQAAVGSLDFYSMTKRMGEEIAARYRDSFDLLILRLFSLYGPTQTDRLVPTIVERVTRTAPVILHPRRTADLESDGMLVTPCFVRDAARVTLALLEKAPSNAILNLAGPEQMSIRDLANTSGELLGIEPHFEISETPREGDLVADLSRLDSLVRVRYTRFRDGLEETIAAR
jgi:nucleoside-diphosphate-sugar epimerase